MPVSLSSVISPVHLLIVPLYGNKLLSAYSKTLDKQVTIINTRMKIYPFLNVALKTSNFIKRKTRQKQFPPPRHFQTMPFKQAAAAKLQARYGAWAKPSPWCVSLTILCGCFVSCKPISSENHATAHRPSRLSALISGGRG